MHEVKFETSALVLEGANISNQRQKNK